jgi:hypothetical protein
VATDGGLTPRAALPENRAFLVVRYVFPVCRSHVRPGPRWGRHNASSEWIGTEDGPGLSLVLPENDAGDVKLSQDSVHEVLK